MTYTLIISLLIQKPLYLLRPQSFSFQIVSEFIDMFVKFSNFMSRGWALTRCFVPRGWCFVHNDFPGGRVFALFKSCPRGLSQGGGVVLGDTCISTWMQNIIRCCTSRRKSSCKCCTSKPKPSFKKTFVMHECFK